jgi:hypothetical protein
MRIAIFFMLLSFLAKGQTDSARMVPLVGVQFSGQLPGGELVKRFGPNLNAGGMFALKTKKNFIVGVESGYFFGRNVKENVLSNLMTSDGFVIDNEGYPADIRITERGLGVHVFFGKVFDLLSANRNSGVMITVGAGYLQHKVKLYDAQQKIAALSGELVRGYDRLSGGPSLTQFVGYLFLSQRRMVNFYFGVEFYEAFTRSYRQLNYDTGLRDTKQRTDILTGFRFGWLLPLYKKRPDEYYFY